LRVLVCGGRDFFDYAKLCETLDGLLNSNSDPLPPPEIVIIHGCAPGADLMADKWAVNRYVMVEEYPADWKMHGPAAGPIRNQRMLDEGKPDIVVAFPGGRGTADMVRRAKAAGVRVIEII